MAQLKSTAVNGNLAVTGAIYADKIAKIGGTNSQILMADGSTLDKNSVGSGNVTGSGLTVNKILLGNNGSAIKVSSYEIVTTLGTDNTSVPTSGAVSTALGGYLTTTGTAADSSKLNGQAASYYATASSLANYSKKAAKKEDADIFVGGVLTGATDPEDDLKYNGKVKILANSGYVQAPGFNLSAAATMVYDTARSAVKFVFS